MASIALSGCSRSYHPEYHPESSYKYVQNVMYAQNVVVTPPAPPRYGPLPIDLEMAAPYVKLWGGDGSDSSKRPPPASAKPSPAPHGHVTSPGAVVIYGDSYGDIFVGR